MSRKRGLGRGLDALLGSMSDIPVRQGMAPVAAGEAVDGSLRSVPVERIRRGRHQPRRIVDESALEELAHSVRSRGIVQPLVVRPTGSGGFEIVAGERRWRAAQMAGLDEVPAVVRELSDREAAAVALIENIQREDLNPIEEAAAFAELQEQFNLTQEQVAEKVGRSRSAVANSLRLLSLPDQIKEHVAAGKLAAGQARALLGLNDKSMLPAAAREVMGKDLSTRDTEALVRRLNKPRRIKSSDRLDPDLSNLVETLQRRLGTRVRLMHRASDDKGKLEIEYYSQEDLDRITNMMIGAG
jgi:ParB family chromosome partitioning protein